MRSRRPGRMNVIVRWASLAVLLLVAASYVVAWYRYHGTRKWGVAIANEYGRITVTHQRPARGAVPLDPGAYVYWCQQWTRRTPFRSLSYWDRLEWGFECGRMRDGNSVAGYFRTIYGVAVPLWAITLAAALASGPSWIYWAKRRRRGPSSCPACGYDRSGLPGRPCPECGAER